MRVLMSPPTEFNVTREINPWMDKKNPPSLEKAWRQWHRLFEIYQRLRLRIYLIRQIPKLEDMEFTANAGWGRKGSFVLANFRHEERRPEQTHFKTWMKDYGFKTIVLPSDIFFEGQGDVVTLKEAYLFGWGIRSSYEAHQFIGRELGLQKEVIPLRLVNKWFYHLDTCLMYIYPLDAILYYPAAFDEESLARIHRLQAEKIEVTEKEMENLVCNGVYFEETIVLGGRHPRIEKLLRARGLEVISTNVSEFKKSGGGARCLTLFLD